MPETLLRIAEDGKRAMTRRINFTLRTLDAIKAPMEGPKDRAWVFDTQVPRLAFMRTRSGAAAFYTVYKFDGRPYRHKLGDEEIGIDQARKLALKDMADIVNGRNPHVEKQRARADMTFGGLFAWYLDNHAKLHKRTWKEDQAKYDKDLKQWASRKYKSITREDVAKLHAKIGGGEEGSPGAANRTLALISSIFNRARMLGYDGTNPAQGIRKFPEHQRERFLSADEVGRFMAALGKESQEWQDFFTLLLFTGARAGNLKSSQWSEMDLKAATWSIPGSKFKTGKPLTIALVPEAIAILKRRLSDRPTNGTASAYVFPCADSASGHIERYEKAADRIIERAEIADLRVHDLRRTLGSWQAASGASLPIIGKSLGHTQQSTTAIYARLNLDPVRQSVGNAVTAMIKASKVKPKK